MSRSFRKPVSKYGDYPRDRNMSKGKRENTGRTWERRDPENDIMQDSFACDFKNRR